MDLKSLKLSVLKYIYENLVDEDSEINSCMELYQTEVTIDPDILDCMEDTFSQTLFKFIKRKDIPETECYKNANLDRRLFSKIRSNDDYQPSKNTVFALIIGLKLNLDEAEVLLESAGYSISHSIKFDLIMEYLIKKQIYDIFVVNEILHSFKCPLLGQAS